MRRDRHPQQVLTAVAFAEATEPSSAIAKFITGFGLPGLAHPGSFGTFSAP